MGFFDRLGSSLVGGAFSILGGKQQNDAAHDEAASARGFTKEQMQKRHQWEVADLKAAGLNPVLSAGAAPSMGASPVADVPSNPLGEGVSTALQSKRLSEEINAIRSQTTKNYEDAKLANRSSELRYQEQKGQELVNKLTASQIPSAKNSARWHSSRAGKFFDAMEKQIDAISPFASSSAKSLEPR